MDNDKTALQNTTDRYLLTADEANAAWQKIERGAPQSLIDYYFHPDYIWLNELAEKGSKAVVVHIESDAGTAWYPALIRALPEQYGSGQFDAISPYGFAGPLVIAKTDADRLTLLGQLGTAWRRYCLDNRIIAEFCRFHPLLDNHRDVAWLENHHVKDVAYFDLTVPQETLLERLHPQKRRSLKKADKSNLSFSSDWAHFDAFKALYHASMARKNADGFYHFSDAFFERLFSLAAQNSRQIKLHSVLLEGAVISSGLFLAAGETVEYFLGANAPQARDVHSSAWMLWQTALESKTEGYKRYVLGGGLKADDELFRFKQQLSPLTAPYRIGRQVIDPNAYERVKSIYQQSLTQSDNGPDLSMAPIFFYRSAG